MTDRRPVDGEFSPYKELARGFARRIDALIVQNQPKTHQYPGNSLQVVFSPKDEKGKKNKIVVLGKCENARQRQEHEYRGVSSAVTLPTYRFWPMDYGDDELLVTPQGVMPTLARGADGKIYVVSNDTYVDQNGNVEKIATVDTGVEPRDPSSLKTITFVPQTGSYRLPVLGSDYEYMELALNNIESGDYILDIR